MEVEVTVADFVAGAGVLVVVVVVDFLGGAVADFVAEAGVLVVVVVDFLGGELADVGVMLQFFFNSAT